ncbi:uncharacterized protein [Pagrus major]|uniref:uncharacterized protein n=1 Tax=Pagrus major TaxID=143350 RepID=UPI003CC8DFB2
MISSSLCCSGRTLLICCLSGFNKSKDMLLYFFLLFCHFTGLIAGDNISPEKDEVSGREGQSVTLTCQYQTSYSGVDLYWYRHRSDLQAPQFILWKGAKGNTECRAQKDNVLQPEGDVTAAKGETATLDCQYNSSSTSPYLFWYKQDGDNSPKFILSRFQQDEGNTPDEFMERFSSTLNPTLRSVPLKIQELQLSDSAVYYCALQPTVTGNTKTLYKNLWSKDNTILHNIH